jgi:hypothetical protein
MEMRKSLRVHAYTAGKTADPLLRNFDEQIFRTKLVT